MMQGQTTQRPSLLVKSCNDIGPVPVRFFLAFLRSLMYSLVNLRDSTHKYNMIKIELYQPENNLNFLFSGLLVTIKAKIKAYMH